MTLWRLFGYAGRFGRLNNKSFSYITQWSRMCSSESNEPVKYSTSRASTWKAEFSRTGDSNEEMPWFQPISIVGSLAVFLIYFCILREENDIDERLSVSLYDRIEGLEETQLRLSLKHYIENGMDTTDIRKRLKELEQEREMK